MTETHASRAGEVTQDFVVACYRVLLGREPENAEVVRNNLAAPNRASVIRSFMGSAEFASGPMPSLFQSDLNQGRFFNRSNPPLVVEHDPPANLLAKLVDEVAATWRALGRSRPHWSVLTGDEYLPERMADETQFHATGERDLEELLATIERVGRRPDEFRTVMEFGCGLGRITNHLAAAFPAVIGCDISTSHLELARAYSKKIGSYGITYQEVLMPDYGMTQPIDLWYSIIVLQHSPPPLIAAILRRMMSKLRMGGLAVFQVPTYARGYRFTVSEHLSRSRTEDSFDLHLLPQKVIFDLMRANGCQLLELVEDERVGDANWISNTFVITR